MRRTRGRDALATEPNAYDQGHRMTDRTVYDLSMKHLPPDEQLRLATFLVWETICDPSHILDLSDEWSDEDMRDFTAYSLRQFDEVYGDEDWERDFTPPSSF